MWGKILNSNITDVAKLAGVSISTVSRVLRDNYPVSDKTKEKVLNAVKTLNFTPNLIASSLKSKQVNLLGVVLPNLKNNVIMSIAESITFEAKKYGYMTLFACTENNEELEKIILNLFRSSLVDAIIAASVMKDDSVFKMMQSINIPVALFDRSVGDIDWVGEDGYRASYDMTKYIISKGHKRIAFLKGVQDITISKERYTGYLDAMKESGIPVIPELQLPGDFKEDKAFDLVRDLLCNIEKDKYPTAIFTSNSSMAKGAMNAILECGHRIPEEISIASYGDLDLPKNARPRITCIRQNAREIGKLITELIMHKIEEKTNKEKRMERSRIIVPVTFDEGESIRDINCRPL
ncbi:MAG: LacI family transcriptional regulator [Anaerolineaceae bacterium]|nr:MAG: LacI family transcriptional regulator [Anaerolineaceae bacterium]